MNEEKPPPPPEVRARWPFPIGQRAAAMDKRTFGTAAGTDRTDSEKYDFYHLLYCSVINAMLKFAK